MSRIIRSYQPTDDPQLMEIEKRSPRGNPPFVHYRPQFIARAQLYSEYDCMVCEEDGALIGCTTVGYKRCVVNGHSRHVGYNFDTRSDSKARAGAALTAECWAQIERKGCDGITGYVLQDNKPMLRLVREQFGIERGRQVRYMEFLPCANHDAERNARVTRSQFPVFEHQLHQQQEHLDFYTPGVARSLAHLGYRQWTILAEEQVLANVSAYEVSRTFVQVPLDEAYPKSEAEARSLATNWQLFDVCLPEKGEIISEVFDAVLADAKAAGVNHVSWFFDAEHGVPGEVRARVSREKDYWFMAKSLAPDWQPSFDTAVYTDPRDL